MNDTDPSPSDKANNNSEHEIKSFNNQVAGHKHSHSSFSNLGMVKLGDEFVLKPIMKVNQGHTECCFYRQIWSSSGCEERQHQLLSLLSRFVPKYFGIVTLRIDNTDVEFLKMEDVSRGLVKPCIADIKIGGRTYHPDSSPQKRILEDMKYCMTKEAFGLSLTGYQVFDLTTGQLYRRGKEFGKSLDKDSLPQALGEIFNKEVKGYKVVVRSVVKRLVDMLSWWHQQDIVNIYGSSVLILYDAFELEKLHDPKIKHPPQSEDNKADMEVKDESGGDAPPLTKMPSTENIGDLDLDTDVTLPWIRVYMIDFAHVVYPLPPTRDDNYIHGLTNLIHLLHNLLD